MVLCKNDLKVREDIKDVIMCPIWQRFGLQKPKVEMDEVAEECQRAFGVVCSFIGTRDLIQEHIAFRVWPLAGKWEMPKETIKESDEGGLVRLKSDKLTELQKKYYDYTCQEGDCIRTCMVPSPQLNENDLEREKRCV